MSKESPQIPCVDCELELAETFIELPAPSAPQQNHLADLRRHWRLASYHERKLFLDWIADQERTK